MNTRFFALSFLVAHNLAAQGVAIGTRIDITRKLDLGSGQFAQVFVPDYFTPSTGGEFLLVVHLHSATWAAENEVYRAHANAVLCNIHLGALSSPYQTYFAAQTNFQKILDTTVAVLRADNIIATPRIARLILSSFSAGYAGIREILKNASHYNRVNALALADGLHCNSDSATMRVQMEDFLRYARDGVGRRKVFLLTHSSIQTSGYENTTATANYLLKSTGAMRVPFSTVDEIGTQYSRCDTGYVHVRGYYGTTAGDHLRHLYGMHMMLSHAVGLLDSVRTDIREPGEREQEGYRLEHSRQVGSSSSHDTESTRSPLHCAGWHLL